MSEIWKDVVGWEGYYQVSDLGNVRSVTRGVLYERWGKGRTLESAGRVLQQYMGTRGYYGVVLFKERKKSRIETHVLVAKAFLGPRPKDHDVHHKDECRINNKLSNLQYVHRSNHHSEHNRGVKAHKARLTEKQVGEVRKLLAQGKTQKEIAVKYGVCRSTIGEIKRGASWAWL